MKTVQTWIDEVKAVPAKFDHWLQRQYVGECLAAERIRQLAELVPEKHKTVLHKIAADEAQHAAWVQGLLEVRGIPLPEVTQDGTRYWGPVLEQGLSVQQLLAAGAHAEEMRLHRIRAIAADPEFPEDVRKVFADILPDEEFHARAFAAAAGPAAVSDAEGRHQQGLEALGLEV